VPDIFGCIIAIIVASIEQLFLHKKSSFGILNQNTKNEKNNT